MPEHYDPETAPRWRRLTGLAAWIAVAVATLAVRAGPADFSRRLVTAKPAGGFCPPRYHFRDWRVVDKASGLAVPTPEEQDVFAVLGLGWVEPRDRS